MPFQIIRNDITKVACDVIVNTANPEPKFMAGTDSANLIRTRRLGKRFVVCGDGVNGVEDGGALVGARVLVCAAHQATAIIRIIAGTPD